MLTNFKGGEADQFAIGQELLELLAREELRGQVSAVALAGAEKILRREVDPRAHGELLDALKRQL